MLIVKKKQTMRGRERVCSCVNVADSSSEKENRCRRACLCSGSFHQQTAAKWKKNTKEITFSSAAAQTKDTKHKEFALSSGVCVCVCVSRNTQIQLKTKENDTQSRNK